MSRSRRMAMPERGLLPILSSWAREDLCREWTLVQARAGFTDAARAEAEAVGAALVDLERLDADLGGAVEKV